ncbi:MAG: DUF4838 domain-containing protein [Pirellulales bacterium]|nr:DUF4838 domain-containing protein [Pirellulales bacterium]
MSVTGRCFSRNRVRAALAAMVLTTWAWTVAANAAGQTKLVLVDAGRAAATIVTAEEPSENARLAALELREYVEKISGASLPVATDAAAPDGLLVLVGPSKLTDRIGDLEVPSGRTRNLQEEGFVIRTFANRLVLAGNDTEPYFGTRYAVAELLHRLGVRWFLPGPIGEVVPTMATVAVPEINVRQRPDFPMRNYWEHTRDNMAAEGAEWKIHNKMNPRCHEFFGVPGDGSVANYLPKDQFDAHPDWFAQTKDGSRNPHHPCTTSEGMIGHFVERIKADARAGQSVSAFAPDDGLPRCWCDRCAKIGNHFDGYGSNDRDPVPESSASNEWFYFVNRILTEVNREFPDHVIATNGYANRDIPPEMPPDVVFNPSKNLTVMFANICACTIHAYDDPKCWQMHRQGQMIRQWCRLSDKVWIYNYNYTMLVGKGTVTPMVHRIRRNIPLLKQWGVIGFHDQDEEDWSLTGIPTRLVRARLEWNVETDVDAVLDDFFAKWYARSAAPMKAYYAALEEAFENSSRHGHEDVILPAIYTEPLMERLGASIRSAEALAQSETEKLHVRIERLIYDQLCEYVAMEKAKRRCDFARAAGNAGRVLELDEQLNAITPFMGWHAYPAYGAEWERKRLLRLAAKTDGGEGRLVAVLPEAARFRVDPHDDGRYQRWQDASFDVSRWKAVRSTAGWEVQGFQDEQGHSYKGVAWYQFDVEVPGDNVPGDDVPGDDVPGAAVPPGVFLCGPAVVNEAWVWVNGRYAGHLPYKLPWFRPQELDLEVGRLLQPGEKNRITVRVLCNIDVFGASGIYERMFLYARKPAAPPLHP